MVYPEGLGGSHAGISLDSVGIRYISSVCREPRNLVFERGWVADSLITAYLGIVGPAFLSKSLSK